MVPSSSGRTRHLARLSALLPPRGHARPLAVNVFVTATGIGLFITTSVLYLTRSVGFPVSQVGLGLTVAGLLGLIAGVPAGHLADRRGAREVYLVALLAEAAAIAAFVLIRSFAMLLAVAMAMAVIESSGAAARGALVARVGGQGGRVQVRAYLRAVTNIGIGAGAGVAGIAVHVDTRGAYLTALLSSSALFLLGAGLMLLLPHMPPVSAAAPTASAPPGAPPVVPPAGAAAPAVPEPSPGGPKWIALRDKRYLAVTALHGVLALYVAVYTFALPLWVVEHTNAPRSLASFLLVGSTLIITALQVRFARGTEHIHRAAVVTRRAGVLMIIACTLLGLAAGMPRVAATVTLVAGVVVLTFAELWAAAGFFGLSFGLAAEHAQGQYQGVAMMFIGASRAIGPAVMSTVCLAWGLPGWILFGCVLAAAGAAVPVVLRQADKRRGAEKQAGVPVAA